jgi:LysM repeat protein
MAAAACLAPQALAEPLPAHTAAQPVAAAQPAAVTDAASYVGVSTAHMLAATRQATENQARSTRAVKYTVRSGDSLSAIAGRVYHNPDAWPVLYWANHSQIRWANVINAGQVLKVPAKPAKIPSAPAQLGPAAPVPTLTAPAPAETTVATPAYVPAASTSSYSGGTPGGSFGQCVVARESGGNSQVMNSSGHYGLYQFSEPTWVAYGGSAGSFGNASVAEQNQVFANAIAQGGQSNWSAYDGC